MDIQFLDQSSPLWGAFLQHHSHDFYHLPQYLAIEASRLNGVAEAILIQEGEKALFVPYILRCCSDLFESVNDVFDVVSPNGYAGILLSESAQDADFVNRAIGQLLAAFRDRRIVSAFFRFHPLINDRFTELYQSEACKVHSETISIDLTLSDEALWSQTRPEHRTKINRCRRSEFQAHQVSFEQNGEDFIDIYTETMNRVGASASFYFTRDYFLQLAEALGEALHVCIVESNQTVICAGLFTEYDGIVQYHLGGTRTAFLKQSPSVLMFDAMRSWSKLRGNHTLHLGGGVGGAIDSLYHFKAGFSKRKHPLFLLRLIPHSNLYQQLIELRAKSLDCSIDKLLQSGFFPAYRAVAQSI